MIVAAESALLCLVGAGADCLSGAAYEPSAYAVRGRENREADTVLEASEAALFSNVGSVVSRVRVDEASSLRWNVPLGAVSTLLSPKP